MGMYSGLSTVRQAFQRARKANMSTTAATLRSMRVAIIGQSNFGAEVYKNVRRKGHEVVGVFTIPDVQVRFQFNVRSMTSS